MENLRSLYGWFDENRDSIIAGHEGEQVLISGDRVIDYYSDDSSAIRDALARGFRRGDFLVQWCVPAEKECLFNYYQEIEIV